MHKKRIYLSAKDWWKDKKNAVSEDLNNAQELVADPEIVELMQELLKDARIGVEITEYFKFSGGKEN